MKQRRFLPTLSELLDRLSIVQLKEVFITEHKEEYAQEIADITHDIQLILSEKDVVITGEMLRAVIVCAQMNLQKFDLNASGGVNELAPLHLAAYGGNLDIVRMLVEAGADIF